ncbi:MAG: ribosome maturation factor RimM [Candidatus Puniceispirillales bacterium]
MADDRVCVGVITAPHGVRGMVKIKPFTETPKAVADYGPVRLTDGRSLRLEVKSISKGMVLARLHGVDNREAAEALKGESLFVDREKLPDAAADEIYQVDLIGCAVDAEAMGEIGTVTAVFDFGAGSMLEVARPEGKPVLIPFGGDHPITVEAGRISLAVDPVWLEE